jgi:hypothetical protein
LTDGELDQLKARIQRLDDIEEIRQLRARYTRFIDRQEWDALRQEITEDFHADTEGGVLDGADAFIGSISKSLAGASTAHHCHTPEISFTGPDSAEGVWAMQDHVKMTLNGSPFSFRGAGHYHDTYRRTDAGWRVSSTALQRLSVDPLTGGPQPG